MPKNKNILSAGKYPALRVFWFSIGIVLSGIGMLGIIVPGLPTTIFMILAAGCFFRSSKKMYHWVIRHPLFGEHVSRFRNGEGKPKKAKYFSIASMWAFVIFALLFALPTSIVWIKYFIVLSSAAGTFYIIRQPNLKT